MLLSSVIIILREVLEAALLISVLLVLTRSLDKSFRWVLWALLAGMIGAMVYGISIDTISEWFDGVGQEVVNALLQVWYFFADCSHDGVAAETIACTRVRPAACPGDDPDGRPGGDP